MDDFVSSVEYAHFPYTPIPYKLESEKVIYLKIDPFTHLLLGDPSLFNFHATHYSLPRFLSKDHTLLRCKLMSNREKHGPPNPFRYDESYFQIFSFIELATSAHNAVASCS